MTLTFDLAGHCDCPSYGSWYIIRVPSCQFWWYYDYSFLIYWPCDIDLWRWRSWRLWLMRSSSSMRVPSLKFVGLAIPKIWRTMCVSINGPGDLDLWPFDLETVCESHLRWGTFLPNLGTLGLWVCELCAMYVTDRRTDKSNAIKSNVIRGGGIITGYIDEMEFVNATNVLSLSVGPFVCLLPNLWTQYFENSWTDFDAVWHEWYMEHEQKRFSGSGGQEVKVTRGWIYIWRRTWRRHHSRLPWIG